MDRNGTFIDATEFKELTCPEQDALKISLLRRRIALLEDIVRAARDDSDARLSNQFTIAQAKLWRFDLEHKEST